MRSGVYFTCCLVLIAGCAQSNWRQAAVPSFVPGKVNAAAQERAMIVEEILDEADLPTRSTVPLLRAQSHDSSSANVSLTSSSATKAPLISHDAATLALIEKETREFSPEDRERAVAALKAIPSESVPAVLQLWKAGLISPLASPTSPVVTAQAKASDFESSVTLAAYEAGTANAGLGQNSPWGNSSLRTSGYSPLEERVSVAPERPAEQPLLRSQQIPRISQPAVGFSSPFPEAPADFDPSVPRVAAVTGRPLTIPPQWDPSRSVPADPRPAGGSVAATPAAPADWPGAMGTPAARITRNGQHSDPFGADSSRPVMKPQDWQNAPPQRAVAVAPDRHAGPVITPQAPAIPSTYPPGRQENVAQQSVAQENLAADQTTHVIEQARFSNSLAGSPRGEIPLAPGQALPGFEGSVVPRAQRIPTAPEGLRGRPQRNVPHPLVAVQSTNEALKFLIKATESEVSQLVPGTTATELHFYIERHVYLRLLYIMSGQTEFALRPIPNVPGADQEFWTQVLWGIHNYFDLPQTPDHAERAAQTISQFNTAMLRLKERAPLELKNVTFCHTIEGFGEYNTYPNDEFTPGQRVLIYAEIGNFHSELSAEGIYRTRLKSTLQVFCADAPDEPVEVKAYPVTEDFCRNHRRDYFHSYVVDIPVRCAGGSHVLKLVIEDELSGKVATYPVPFTVR